VYEGYPNAFIAGVNVRGDTAAVTLERDDGSQVERAISGLAYVIGRRGSLKYLDKALRQEVCGPVQDTDMPSGRSLREKALDDLEVAPDAFIVGSLTGDSLIRFAFGSCTRVAGRIMGSGKAPMPARCQPSGLRFETKPAPSRLMNGLEEHNNLRTGPEDTPEKHEWQRNSK